MRIEKDFVELLKLFNKNKVKYLIVGAFAVGFYGYPRYSKDIDVLVESSVENAKRIIAALREFGGYKNLEETDFNQGNKIIQLGYEPVRVDILTSLEGEKFKTLWKNKEAGYYGKQRVFFIGLRDIKRNKRRSGRLQDLADLEKL